ncbi:MAG: hypothetical protein JRJ77_03920 [Deltaproteobacteria bacterium]|nr:hypothetical protein [Deltaproteobacteria bacterium]
MLVGDLDRFKKLAKRDPSTLTTGDFNGTDGRHLLRMVEKIAPKKRVEKIDAEGNVKFQDIPDLSEVGGTDEISLLVYLKKHKKL